jgi:hypothetical protein
LRSLRWCRRGSGDFLLDLTRDLLPGRGYRKVAFQEVDDPFGTLGGRDFWKAAVVEAEEVVAASLSQQGK